MQPTWVFPLRDAMLFAFRPDSGCAVRSILLTKPLDDFPPLDIGSEPETTNARGEAA